jgi:alkaline phosphatase D
MNASAVSRRGGGLPAWARIVALVIVWVAWAIGTAHAADLDPARPVTRITVGSCIRQNRPQPIWEAVARFRADVLLLLGDNIYGDTEDMAELRAAYDVLAANPGFAPLRRDVPIIAVWDDHDYGVNDGGREYPRRRESQQVFCDFFGVTADSPRRQREGIYHAITCGPPGRRVQFIGLDTRYHRSPLKALPREQRVKGGGFYVPDPDPAATFLGADQWAWLATVLTEPAEIRIVLSSIQVAATEHGFEKWANFPVERERLFKTIREAEATGVIIVSGDRHAAEVSRMPAGADALAYPLYDLTASSLNQVIRRSEPPEPNRFRMGDRYHGTNFGTIEIDWKEPPPTGQTPLAAVTLAIRDAQGAVVESATLDIPGK